MMKLFCISILGLIFCFLGCTPTKIAPDGTEAFRKLKTLEGNWISDQAQGLTNISFSLGSSESIVIEKMTAVGPDSSIPPSMMSVYHLDNTELMMTHFCGQGNQPRMRADGIGRDTIHFSAVDVTNLPSPDSSHMVAVTFIFKRSNWFAQEWVNRANGKEEKWKFEFTRVE